MTPTSQTTTRPQLTATMHRSPTTGLSPTARPTPATRSMQRWLEPTELERRLEAHLLIARKLRG